MPVRSLLQSAFFAATAVAYALPGNPTPNDSGLIARGSNIPTCGDLLPVINGEGSFFCLSRWHVGMPISQITAYKESSGNANRCESKGAINRLEIRYADGSTDYVGGDGVICAPDQQGGQCNHCEAGHIELADDETIKEWYIGKSVENKRGVGNIFVKTDKQSQNLNKDATSQSLFATEIAVKPQSTYVTRGGILTGITGRVDGDIVINLALHYTDKTLKSFEGGSIVYDQNALKNAKVDKTYIWQRSYDGNANQTFDFEDVKTSETSSSIEQSNQFSFGMKYTWSMSYEFPAVVKLAATGEYSFSTQYTNTRTQTDKNTNQFRSTLKGSLNPGEWKNCYIATGTYTGDVPFTRNVTLTFDGKDEPVKYIRRGKVNFKNLVAPQSHATIGCPPGPVENPDPLGIGIAHK